MRRRRTPRSGTTHGSVNGAYVALALIPVAAILIAPAPARAIQDATLRGRVTAEGGGAVPYASVRRVGSAGGVVSDANGVWIMAPVPAGEGTLEVSRLGFRALEVPYAVSAGETRTMDVTLELQPIALDEVSVTAPSRLPERIVEAPAAVSVVEAEDARRLSVTGQLPLLLAQQPGIDIVQSDVTDFNVNARGFNTSLNRRVLVLQDGRDVSIAFLGSQEWTAFTMPLEDIDRIEMVRGPGSALYGANAFAGVMDIRTPRARETVGSKVTVGGGTLATVRADVRNGGLLGDGSWAYRLNLGYSSSDTWNRSRTGLGDLEEEYADATDEPFETPVPGFELRPVAGQTLAGPLPSSATGTPDRLTSVYGGARLDRYGADGSELTLEGGASRVENEIVVTGAGRIQRDLALRPWARAAWANSGWAVSAWYTGRIASDPGWSLATNTPIDDRSHVVQGEIQHNRLFADGRARAVVGGSLRNSFIDSRETLIPADDDARNDLYGSLYGQVDYALGPTLRLVGAARLDKGDIFDAEISPKAALVYQPTAEQAFRLSVNRAYQIPNTLELYVSFPAGAPVDLTALEAGLRASPLGEALENVPEGELFTTSAAVPILALGNRDLEPERVTSAELGYRRQFGDRLSVSVDTYFSRLSNFVTDLLPGVNPAYPSWSADPRVPEDARDAVEEAALGFLAEISPAAAAGLTRLPDGATAVVLSLGNAGEVDEWGVELSASAELTGTLRAEGSYSLFEFEVDSSAVVPGDQVLPNTPEHKVKLSLAYQGEEGLSARADARFVSAFEWASGIFAGPVPASQTLDLSAGYAISDRLTVRGVATNVLDQERYQIFGGAVLERRLLGSVTWTF
ncbi:MAG TPA: TonB-dependent receptor [Longimicrobiales bacterium]|nr:TonB-dependent receptor [Longimicrobiales bacterium]